MQSRKDLQKLADALGGMPVWGCLPGSPSHRAGIIYGDILLEVNGQKVDSVSAYAEAKELDPEYMHVKILRNGDELELDLDLFGQGWDGTKDVETKIRSMFEEDDGELPS